MPSKCSTALSRGQTSRRVGRSRLDDLAHLLFDLRQVFGRERFVAREIVIEAVLDRRADGHLGAGIELLHRHGEHMRHVVADQLQRFRVFLRDDADLRVVLDRAEQVPLLAVDFEDERRLGQARTDGGRDLAACHAARERHRLAVGQGDGDVLHGSRRGHGSFSFGRKSGRTIPMPPRKVKATFTFASGALNFGCPGIIIPEARGRDVSETAMKTFTTAWAAAGLAACMALPAHAAPVCLQTIQIDHTSVKDPSTVLFYLKNGQIWRNTLQSPCPALLMHGFRMNVGGGENQGLLQPDAHRDTCDPPDVQSWRVHALRAAQQIISGCAPPRAKKSEGPEHAPALARSSDRCSYLRAEISTVTARRFTERQARTTPVTVRCSPGRSMRFMRP